MEQRHLNCEDPMCPVCLEDSRHLADHLDDCFPTDPLDDPLAEYRKFLEGHGIKAITEHDLPSPEFFDDRNINAFVMGRPSLHWKETMEWQPIETAPKDTRILVCQGRNNIIDVARGDINEYGNWRTGPSPMDYIAEVTHWMPLPAPPEHDSDCARHNEPAMPNGPCDCSVSSQ